MTEALTRVAARKASGNADQVEADAVRLGSCSVAACLNDESTAIDTLADEYDAATVPQGSPSWDADEAARETAVGNTAIEIERRQAFLGSLYPFDFVDNQMLVYQDSRSRTGIYEFCLAISETRQQLTSHPACRSVREFERLVGRLLQAFLHGDSYWYRSGAPAEDDRPTRLSEVIRDLHARTCEWEFHPPTGPDAPAEDGDGSIDIVAWKVFGANDQRLGKPFFLAQCACGGNDDYWFGKRSDLNPREFERTWGGTISFAGVLKCLATPRHVPHSHTWRKATSAAGIMLDRVRLVWMGETCLSQEARDECRERLESHTALLNQGR